MPFDDVKNSRRPSTLFEVAFESAFALMIPPMVCISVPSAPLNAITPSSSFICTALLEPIVVPLLFAKYKVGPATLLVFAIILAEY